MVEARKTVPLVIYKDDGERVVIGDAVVVKDEKGLFITGNVEDVEVGKALRQTTTHLSLGPVSSTGVNEETEAIIMDRSDWDPNYIGGKQNDTE